MIQGSDNCSFCRPVKFVCFWGAMPIRAWKRPVLLIASAAIAVGFLALGFLAEGEQDIGERIAVAVGVLIGLVGTSVAIFACNKCVARVFGSV